MVSPMAPQRHPLSGWPRRFLDWLCEGRADYREFRQRRETRAYKNNQVQCLITWLGAAGLMLLCAGAGCLLLVGLIATLICFTLLDPD
jgi:hypothetical protein